MSEIATLRFLNQPAEQKHPGDKPNEFLIYRSFIELMGECAKPKNPTIAKLFNTHRFVNYQDKVKDLLMQMCTVSVKTIENVKIMKSYCIKET